jgi:hypothetical protein
MNEKFEDINKIEKEKSADNTKKEADLLLNSENENTEDIRNIDHEQIVIMKSVVDSFMKFVVSDNEYQKNKEKKGYLTKFNTKDFLIRYKNNIDDNDTESKKMVDNLLDLIEDKQIYGSVDETLNEMLLKYDENKHKIFLRECLSYFYYGNWGYTFEGGEDEGKFTKQIFDKKPDVVFLSARSAVPWGIIYKEWAKSFKKDLEGIGRTDLVSKVPSPLFKLADVKLGRLAFSYKNNLENPDYKKSIHLDFLSNPEIRHDFLTKNDDDLLKWLEEEYASNLASSTSDQKRMILDLMKKEALITEKAIERYAEKLKHIKIAIEKGEVKEPVKIAVFDESGNSGITRERQTEAVYEAINKLGIKAELIKFKYLSGQIPDLPYAIKHEENYVVSQHTSEARPDFLNVIDQFQQKLNYELFKEVGRKDAQNISSDSDRMNYFIERIEKL